MKLTFSSVRLFQKKREKKIATFVATYSIYGAPLFRKCLEQ